MARLDGGGVGPVGIEEEFVILIEEGSNVFEQLRFSRAIGRCDPG